MWLNKQTDRNIELFGEHVSKQIQYGSRGHRADEIYQPSACFNVVTLYMFSDSLIKENDSSSFVDGLVRSDTCDAE